MGCVSSTLLSQDDEFPQIGASTAFSHHIVSLTSTTYGLLSLDPPPHSPTSTVAPTPPRITLGSLFPSPLSEPRSLRFETINSWDLMSGLDADHIPSLRFASIHSKSSDLTVDKYAAALPSIHSKSSDLAVDKYDAVLQGNEENFSPNVSVIQPCSEVNAGGDLCELTCPPNGENKVVIYTTTLRGVRKTFDDCNAVRSAMEGLGVSVHERDISMDRGFRDELRELMKGRGRSELIPPRVFIKGRYIGGFEEVMKVVEEGSLGELVKGLPRLREGYVCEGCGGVRFLPCFRCNGSCKTVVEVEEGIEVGQKQGKRTVIVRCSDCNENGLVHCPICS